MPPQPIPLVHVRSPLRGQEAEIVSFSPTCSSTTTSTRSSPDPEPLIRASPPHRGALFQRHGRPLLRRRLLTELRDASQTTCSGVDAASLAERRAPRLSGLRPTLVLIDDPLYKRWPSARASLCALIHRRAWKVDSPTSRVRSSKMFAEAAFWNFACYGSS